MGCFSQTATVEVTVDGTAIEVHLGCLSGSCGIGGTFYCTALRGIHLTLGATAIDITRNRGIAFVNINGITFQRSIGPLTDIHHDISRNGGRLTEATTEDVASDIDSLILIDRTDVHRHIAIHVGREAAAVDAGSNRRIPVC